MSQQCIQSWHGMLNKGLPAVSAQSNWHFIHISPWPHARSASQTWHATVGHNVSLLHSCGITRTSLNSPCLEASCISACSVSLTLNKSCQLCKPSSGVGTCLRYNNLDELYHAKSEEGLSRLLAFLREEEERERLEQIERMKPIGTQVSAVVQLAQVSVQRRQC